MLKMTCDVVWFIVVNLSSIILYTTKVCYDDYKIRNVSKIQYNTSTSFKFVYSRLK